MKTKVTYSEVKEALEAGYVSPLNSDEMYQEFEYVGRANAKEPAQMKAPAFYAEVGGKKVVGGHKWANVSPYMESQYSRGCKYVGRIVNGWFELKKERG